MLEKVIRPLLTYCSFSNGAFTVFMYMVDTTKDMGKGMLSIYNRFNHIRIGGYLQPQFQIVGGKGAKSYEGATFLQMLITDLC